MLHDIRVFPLASKFRAQGRQLFPVHNLLWRIFESLARVYHWTEFLVTDIQEFDHSLCVRQ